MVTEILLLFILVVVTIAAVALSYQSERQHVELMQFIDAFAESIGKAIEKEERN